MSGALIARVTSSLTLSMAVFVGTHYLTNLLGLPAIPQPAIEILGPFFASVIWLVVSDKSSATDVALHAQEHIKSRSAMKISAIFVTSFLFVSIFSKSFDWIIPENLNYECTDDMKICGNNDVSFYKRSEAINFFKSVVFSILTISPFALVSKKIKSWIS